MLTEILDHYDIVVTKHHGEAAYKCPLHNDTHASATANLDDEVWYCHVCGVGGDAIKLISLMEGITFRDAYTLSKNILAGSSGSVRGEPDPGGYRLPRTTGHHRGSRKWVPNWISK